MELKDRIREQQKFVRELEFFLNHPDSIKPGGYSHVMAKYKEEVRVLKHLRTMRKEEIKSMKTRIYVG